MAYHGDIQGHASVAITLDTYSHVFFEVDNDENSEPNVSKMLANGDGVECRPYRSRTCDTLIKRYKPLVPPSALE
jgi:hypothetical protein